MISCWLLSGAAALALRGSTAEQVHAGQEEDTRDGIWYLEQMLDRFGEFAHTTNTSVIPLHRQEEWRLQREVDMSPDPLVKVALQQSIAANKETLGEEQSVFAEMFKFIGTMKSVIGRVPMDGHQLACANMRCGKHASCSRTTAGAECICDEGFEGDGMKCTAPSLFVPQRLLRDGLHGGSSKVADLSIAMFYGSQLVITFRDMSSKNAGKVMIGDFTPGHVHWSPPEKFASGMAFDPVCVGLPTNRIVIAYRDQDREATLFLIAGELDASGVRGTPKHITYGQPVQLARAQAHRAALLPLGEDKAVSFYTEFRAATKETPERHFAAATLSQIGHIGAVSELGTFHFLEFAATRLTANLLSPTTFVVGYRGAKAVDDMNTDVVRRQEASAIYGELVDTELVFDPHPIDLEPETTNIWDRGISLLGPNTFGYAYQTGLEAGTHLAIVHVDPATHHMAVKSRTLLAEGFSPYVRMVDLPYAIEDPHTFTYYQHGDQSIANLCAIDLNSGNLSKCESTTWMDRELSSVASTPLGSGRTLIAFADKEGVPYYHVIGLSQK
jgi:hypothetical protein